MPVGDVRQVMQILREHAEAVQEVRDRAALVRAETIARKTGERGKVCSVLLGTAWPKESRRA
jgi:hypothetical protein